MRSHEMLCHAMVNDEPGGMSVCSHPPPRKISSPVKIAFWGFLFDLFLLAAWLFSRLAWDQVPQWGKKAKKRGQIGKISASEAS